ncbi:MAG: peptide ABC transporter substrate-binding protein [Clostridiaceae bacterium]|nr:peptide ABC transporter substrate-binding protein [Clostridiaceae bacterium]
MAQGFKKFLIIILSLLIFLSSCASNDKQEVFMLEEELPGEDEEAILKDGGTLKLSMRIPNTLNPIYADQKTVVPVLSLIYDSLIYLDENLTPQPNLAKGFKVSSNALEVTFYLRDDIYWHDGTPFTAKDVEATFRMLLGHDTIYSEKVKDITSCLAQDDYTFKIILARPNSTIVSAMNIPIVPRHVKNLDENPIGTGQFKFESMRKNKSITLVANKDYFKGAPHADRVEITLTRDNQTAEASFLRGLVHAVTDDVIDLSNFAIKKGVSVKYIPSLNFEFLGFNCKEGVFQNANVRRAVSGALDVQKIVNDVYMGRAEAATIPIHPKSGYYQAGLMEKNLDEARELLILSGYMQGEREFYKNGQAFSFSILVNEENVSRVAIAQSIKNELSSFGIGVNIVTLPFDEYREKILEKDYDAFLGGVDIAVDLDLGFLFSGNNYFGFSDMAFDSATYGIQRATTDEDLKNAISVFESEFYKKQPILGIGFLNNALIYNLNLAGDVAVFPQNPYYGAYMWYVNQGEK